MIALDEAKFAKEDSVYPDVIVHRRGSAGPNLLVVEAKKNPNYKHEEVKRDQHKLKSYKDVLGYSSAVFLEIWTNGREPPLVPVWY